MSWAQNIKINNKNMNIVTITATLEDGSTVILFPVPVAVPAPTVAPTDVEVDLILSDGTTKKFVPAV